MIDPFVTGNPKTPADQKDLAKLGKVDVILVTHGHCDHVGTAGRNDGGSDLADLAKHSGAKVFGPAGLIQSLVELGSGDVLHLVREISARRRRRERSTFAPVQLDCIVDDSTQLVEYGFLVVAVAAAIDQARRTPDIAAIFVRPLNDLHVPGAIFHLFDSWIAN